MTIKACSRCGAPAQPGSNRCHRHPPNPISARPHRRVRAAVLADADRCWICGQPPTADDPLTFDHVTPRNHGGVASIDNARAAHLSCNSRRGDAPA
jgi:5-methylcytosine-specific restriction endonuclease McrA